MFLNREDTAPKKKKEGTSAWPCGALNSTSVGNKDHDTKQSSQVENREIIEKNNETLSDCSNFQLDPDWRATIDSLRVTSDYSSKKNMFVCHFKGLRTFSVSMATSKMFFFFSFFFPRDQEVCLNAEVEMKQWSVLNKSPSPGKVLRNKPKEPERHVFNIW